MPTSTALLSPLQRTVLHALALGARPRPRTWIHQLLGSLPVAEQPRLRPTQEAVRLAVTALAEQDWIVEGLNRTGQAHTGYWQLHPARWAQAYADLLDSRPIAELLQALSDTEGVPNLLHSRSYDRFTRVEGAVALTRLALFSGGGPLVLERLQRACGWALTWDDLLHEAVFDVLETSLFPRLHPLLQATLLEGELASRTQRFHARLPLPVVELSHPLLALPVRSPAEQNPPASDTPPTDLPDPGPLRLALAELAQLSGDLDEAERLLAPLLDQHEAAGPRMLLIAATKAFRAARWADSERDFDSALRTMKKLTGLRKGVFPVALLTPHVLTLMAQPDSAKWQQALKLCLAEAGSKRGATDSPWSLMALALKMRLGDERREPGPFRPRTRASHVLPEDWWRWLMRAWITERDDAELATWRLQPAEEEAAATLRAHLSGLGLNALVDQLDAALCVVRHQPAPSAFFVAPPLESWQTTLAALATLGGDDTPAPAAGPAGEPTRLWWILEASERGLLRGITPMEQKRGPRGWGRAREVPLSRLAKAAALPAWDAAVVRCIRASNTDRSPRLDLAAAASALLGHPLLAWHDRPDLPVTLVEASPELEVIEQDDTLRVRLQPTPHTLAETDEEIEERLAGLRWARSVAEQKEVEALLELTVLRDEPQRARLIRLTPAQRRAAQLLGHGLTVPRAASGELQRVLQGLGAHFQIHADELAASREVTADARLRAELHPEGDGVMLRLVVAPLGEAGPRRVPGSGRARLIAAVGGETLGAHRDLAAELSHLDTVLDTCPMLAPLPQARPGQTVPAVWTVHDPQQALALVERLHALHAVSALDWPRGKAIRVDGVGIGQLSVNVTSGQTWLGLEGGVKVDEQLVFSLQQLLDWNATARGSRFVALGEGRYLALTEELRGRVAELAAVAEPAPSAGRPGQGDVRITPLAAGWLQSQLEGAELATDEAFRDRIETLVRAQHWHPRLPSTLQASLRPYQEEGYQWALRLAEAGLGAVLADDMGLGKTLQALAVLLERAAGGPALVVAPTSLTGNWIAEARRFAPTLDMQDFGTGDREALIAGATAGTVVVVSYPLQQIHAAALAARRWHTLVLDEAQAIKNAATKRSQAAFELAADFRLALSGTPIENRLAELWSIMRVCNPGLLGTLAQFNSRFAVPIERDRHQGARRTLKRLVQPFILRRTKAQVLDDLPERTELVLRVQGNETERSHYEALRRQAVRDAERALKSDTPGQAHLNVLAQLTRLRRAACDPRLVTPELQQPGAKVLAFTELAAELKANGHKALVFSQFVDFLALLRAPLEAAGFAVQYLDGSTPATERTARVAAFQAGEGDFFLISLKAGGFGLNLTAADYVVIADPWWNPAAEDQASGRAHRIGQQRPVTVYRLVNQDTLEDRILALHQDKRELAEGILDASAEDGSAPQRLRSDDLMALLRG